MQPSLLSSLDLLSEASLWLLAPPGMITQDRLEVALRRLVFLGAPKATCLISSNVFSPNLINACSEAFIAIVILAASMDPLPRFARGRGGYDVIEYYAGRARISRLARLAGYRSIATDVKYDMHDSGRSALDLCCSAGFA